MVTTDEKLCYTMEEAAAQVGAGRTTMFELVASGEIPSIKVGRRRVIPAESLKDFIERQLRSSSLVG